MQERHTLKTRGRPVVFPMSVEYASCWKPKDRKSTRLNSSHGYISYAVFCLKKKKKRTTHSGHLASGLCGSHRSQVRMRTFLHHRVAEMYAYSTDVRVTSINTTWCAHPLTCA